MRDRVEVLMPLPDGRFLVERLADPRWPANVGKLRCPGGKIEAGETAVAAAVRELLEEYSLDLIATGLTLHSVTPGPRGQITRLMYAYVSQDWIGRLMEEGGGEMLVAVNHVPALWL